MPKITVIGKGSFEVDKGTRLVLALENNGVDVSHRCGGYAKCTTCRCSIETGEPKKWTKAEKQRVQKAIDDGDEQMKNARLSCQISVEQDMTVNVLLPVSKADWDDPGKTPEKDITPDPQWVDE